MHRRRTYERKSDFEHDYLDSDLVQGVLGQIAEEEPKVTRDIVDEIIEMLDGTVDELVTKKDVLSEFPNRREAADNALFAMDYYLLIQEGKFRGDTIVGLHPDGKQAARKGYERDQTRRTACH